ncbi:MAG: hypothetical protein HY435_01920 [Candidatus Liptonbacteria bacterium]|nr:hypothetical protein [Candidatus Liptonbacteria bacterium]
MPPLHSNKGLISAVLILAATLYLRFYAGVAFGFLPDFVLAALITFSLFLGFFELVFIVSLAAFFLHWHPLPGIELYLLFIIPFTLFFMRKIIFAVRGWLANIVSVMIGIAAFYAVSSFQLVSYAPYALLEDIVLAGIYGLFVYGYFKYFYGREVQELV